MNPNITPPEIVTFLELREGIRHEVYLDTRNIPTAGMGHRLSLAENSVYKVGDPISTNLVYGWAELDSLRAYKAALSQSISLKIDNPTPDWIRVLTSVNFQNGTAWYMDYPKTWALMLSHSWEAAAVEVQNSKWFTQTPILVQEFQAAIRALIA